MKRRILSLILALTLAVLLFSVAASAGEYDGIKTYAVDRATGERYADGETVRLSADGELFLRFELDPDDPDLLIGWRNELLEAEGFAIDEEPYSFDGDDNAYAHIQAGSKEPGDVGTLYYNVYKLTDIFGPEAVGWKNAQPVFTGSVKIEVVSPEEQPFHILGDADDDRELTILDATTVQRFLVDLPVNSICLLTADADRDGELTILDATAIQRWLVDLPTGAAIGDEVSYGTYYAAWMIGQELLPANCELTGAEAERACEAIRCALNLLVDRVRIVTEGIPVDRLPASTFVSKWITDADGSEFFANACSSGYGYFDSADNEENVRTAVDILKLYYDYDGVSGRFTNVPKLTYAYNNSPVHESIAAIIQSCFADVGIELEIIALDWNTYTQAVAEGSYSLARSGWLIDDDDPMGFLEMWQSGNEENMIGFGAGAYENAAVYSLDLTDCGIDFKAENATWAQTYDKLIELIRGCEDRELAYLLMHKAEDMLMATGCIMPLYYY